MPEDFADRLVAAQAPRRETKQLIYRHSLRLFAERGYARTSLREIAGAVGLEVPSLYTHISSKQALLFHLMEFGNRDLKERLVRATQGVPGDRPVDRLYLLVRENVISHCRHREQTTVVFNEIGELDEGQRVKIIALRRAIEDLFREALKDGIATGALRQVDISVTTFGALAIGRGAATWYRESGALSPEQIGDLYGEQVVRGIITPAVATDWTAPAEP